MTIRYETNDRTQALDQNQLLELLTGSAWISGLDATASNGNMTVDVTAGDALVDGAAQTVTSGSVTIPTADANLPRKDLIYVDTTGGLAVLKGTPDEAIPAGTTHEHAGAPALPDGIGLAGTPIWEVWVAAGTTSIATADLRDRRVSADVVFNAATVADLSAEAAAVTTAPSAATDVTRKGDLDSHGGDANAHHAQNHAARHAQGGADVLDAADLSGASGSSGQVLQSDGTGALWSTPAGTATAASETDDGSDVTIYRANQTNTSSLNIVNVTGSGILLSGFVTQDDETPGEMVVDYTVDGGTTYTYSGVVPQATSFNYAPLHAVVFDSSLTVTARHTSGFSRDHSALATVKQ